MIMESLSHISLLLAFFLLFTTFANATKYHLVKDYASSGAPGFYKSFHFFNETDPTHGYVQYLSHSEAVSSALVGFTAPNVKADIAKHAIYMGVDHAGPTRTNGRSSVRIKSKKKFNAGTLLVADIAHMPTGCGVWPAFWLLGGNKTTIWPEAGEVDIIEQVNLAEETAVTLHTTAGCALDPSEHTEYSGHLDTANCDVNDPTQPPNAGCSIHAPSSSASFGESFNQAGGGIFVTEWKQNPTSTGTSSNGGFAVWFFPRANVPPSLQAHKLHDLHQAHHGAHGNNQTHAHDLRDTHGHRRTLDTSAFGKPIALFSGGTSCDWAAHFRDMHLVINIALCGDWAGGESWNRACAGKTGGMSCEEYVAAHPEAFRKAYWEILGLRLYTTGERAIRR